MKNLKVMVQFVLITICILTSAILVGQSAASADQCASFNFNENVLEIPCFNLGGYSYWLDLSLVPNDTALVFQLTDFGSNSECQDDDVQNGIYRSCNYFPYQKGNFYIENYGSRTNIATMTDESFTFSTGSGKAIRNTWTPCEEHDLYYASTNNGLEITGIYDREENKYLSMSEYNGVNSFLTLKKEMKIGDSWFFDIPGEATLTFRFVNVEKVAVPAGIFESCLKVQVDIDANDGGDYTTIFWYAKNIGVVKVERTYESQNGYEGCYLVTSEYPKMELQNAYVNGISYP